jgi:uncharacterized membrane protein YphA (DoxX/SURF4 family)
MRALVSRASVLRAIGVTVALVALAIVLANVLGSLVLLGLTVWAVAIVTAAVGVFLLARAGRPLAGAGAIVVAASILIAFFVQPQAWLLWTVLFFVGVILIARGTAEDRPDRAAWPLLLPRVAVGWALVDNAQDHFWNGWIPNGGGFLQSATGAVNRQPLYFLDPLYQSFLSGVVVPNAGVWASLTACGELVFGTMLAVGLCTPVGAIGAMWQNGNYMLMKGFVAHSAYTDKTFFAVELFCLITLAGLAYGLDASLRRHVPAMVAGTLLGVSDPERESRPREGRQPQLA